MAYTEYEYTNPVKLLVASDAQKHEAIQFFLSYGFKNPQPGEIGIEVGQVLLSVLEKNKTKVTVSLGEKENISANTLRKTGASITKWLNQFSKTSSTIHLTEIDHFDKKDMLSAFLEGLYLGSYTFSKWKSTAKKSDEIKIYLDTNIEPQKVKPLIKHARIVTEAVNMGRDWAHEPANVINPVSLAQRVQVLAQTHGLKCTILDESTLSQIKAGGILSVGQGSKTPSRLIILEYPGSHAAPETKPIVLIGKAITFDTGGYSLKDTANIQNMKYDKSGGIAVVAVMQAVAALKIKNPVIGMIAAAENMISQQAYRPDDIITTLSGKTVEVITTDAEGRLILADALTYAQQKYNPEAMIDLATLTGGVVVALGRVRAGLMSNNDVLANALLASGESTHERLWRLPLDQDYFSQIEGDDADLKNSGGREATPVIGGIFLKEFVSNQIPWAHIDIAGVANTDKPNNLGPKGATGFGIRLLIDFLEKFK
ncbi:MAG: leucyl aminopeptidase [Anaerolineae bacterium]|nr:leucyl aminopeptidase [Anaerolineae bacterium]